MSNQTDKEILGMLRIRLMARAAEMSQRGAENAGATNPADLCKSIQSSGHAQGLLEAITAIEQATFSWSRAANDNARIVGGDFAN